MTRGGPSPWFEMNVENRRVYYVSSKAASHIRLDHVPIAKNTPFGCGNDRKKVLANFVCKDL